MELKINRFEHSTHVDMQNTTSISFEKAQNTFGYIF